MDVLLDVYDLPKGADKYHFMERAVKEEVSKVIVLCNPLYKEKSDNREGGVGTESTIISSEVYD